MTITMPRTAKLLAALLLLPVAAPALHAQDWAKARLDASPRHHEYVPLKHGNRTVQAFVVYPEVKTKAPVIVLIHEIFGLSDWAKEMADELAGQGFIVVAPDLLTGFGPNNGNSDSFPSMDATTKAVSGLDAAVVTADLDVVQFRGQLGSRGALGRESSPRRQLVPQRSREHSARFHLRRVVLERGHPDVLPLRHIPRPRHPIPTPDSDGRENG